MDDHSTLVAVNLAIWQFLSELHRQNPRTFNPIDLAYRVGSYSTDGIEPVVRAVSQLPGEAVQPWILKNFIKQDAHGLRFGVKAALAQGMSPGQISDIVRATHSFEITEPEIALILDTPEMIIKIKKNHRDEHLQELYMDGEIHSFKYTNGKEAAYLMNPRAYVISRMMINDVINDISNPISTIANDYSYLEEFYFSKALDRTKDTQFSKYSLFAITNKLDFSSPGPPRIYDLVNNVTVFLCGIEDFIFTYLRDLKQNYDFELSFKPSSRFFAEHRFEASGVLEHIETGHYFSRVNLDEPLITKLYNNKYDTLWINVYDSSITFEEFQDDFQFHEENIVTQVLHCEYFKKGDSYYIKHLDHEFIFYTIDEYNRRQNDAWQKGGAQKRIKTFKIDNGSIPITKDLNVLFDVLEMKFINNELIREYFEKVQQAD